MSALKIAVTGAAGRMGQTLIRYIDQTDGCTLAGATEALGHDAIGQDVGVLTGLGAMGIVVSDQAAAVFDGAEAVIDFTLPGATLAHAELTADRGLIHVIGTTGLTQDQETAIQSAAAKAVIVKSGNMSLGINLLAHLVKQTAALLDDDFDIEILEMHHRHKVDAPSGTALLLGAAAAEGRGVDLADKSDRARDGHTGERGRGQIGFAVMRGGSVVGEHKVLFAADSERIELSHIAEDRGIFARGALRAALWARDREPGLYSMTDVLGF